MRHFIQFSVLLITVFVSQNLEAKWKMVVHADFALEKDDSVVDVAADGSSTLKATQRWIPFTAAGKEELAQSKIYYDPNDSKIEFVSARTLAPTGLPFLMPGDWMMDGDGKPIPPPKDSQRKQTPVLKRSVIEKEVGIAEKGVTSQKALIIPFSNLEIRSNVEYTYIQRTKPPASGSYSQTFVYGASFPELAGSVLIRSVKPLFYKVTDKQNVLKVTESKEGKLHLLKIEIARPAYFVPVDEPSFLISREMYPRVLVGTAPSWSEVVRSAAVNYESAISKPLPPEFVEIKQAAATQSTDDARFNSVMSALASKLTYAGKWSTNREQFYPKGHAVVAKQKTGDCKDFAATTAGILRTLGYKADVALTSRTPPSDEMMKDFEAQNAVPSLSYFNHAIVRVVMKDGKERWLDPTNYVGDADNILSDIRGSTAIVLSKDTKTLSQIPKEAVDDSFSELSVNARKDGMYEVNGSFRLVGQSANQVRQVFASKGPAVGNAVLRRLLTDEYKTQGEPSLSVISGSNLSTDFKAAFKFVINERMLLSADKSGIFAPYPFRYKVLGYANGERETGVYLGDMGVSKGTTTIIGVKGVDDISSDCLVLSKWFDIERTAEKTSDGVRVHDVLTQKVTSISNDDLKSSAFSNFLYEAQSCVGSPVVQLESNTKNSKLLQISALSMQKARELTERLGPGTGTGMFTAMRYLDRLIAKEPENYVARALRARAIYRLGYNSGDDFSAGNLQRALADVDYVLQKQPNHIDALHVRAAIHYYRGDISSSAADLNKLRTLAPNDGTSTRIASKIALSKGRTDDAEKWLLFGLSVAKDKSSQKDFYGWLGGFYLDSKQYPKATASYKKALEIDSKDQWIWNNLSIAHRKAEQFDDAITSARKALEIGTFGAAKANLADALCKKSEKAMKSAKTSADYDMLKTSIEEPLFEGLKVAPDSFDCLLLAGLYYEKRTFELKEKDSAARSSEYFTRLHKVYDPDHIYMMAGMNMDSVAKQLARDIPLETISIEKPSESIEKLNQRYERMKKAAESAAKTENAASKAPASVDSKK